MRYHYISIRMAKIWNTDNTKCCWGCGATGTHLLVVGIQNGIATLEDILAVSNKTNHTLTIWSSHCISWYLPKRVENLSPHKKTCTCRFTATLFIIAKTWKQPRCPSVGEWINKLWSLQTVEYHSALKRNEPSSHEKTWMDLKCILLSERSQSEKAIYCKFQIYNILEKGKLQR